MDVTDLAKSLFEAFASGNAAAVRRLCHADMTARQNNGSLMGLEELLAFSAAVNGIVSDFEYANPRRSATVTGFVEEHDVRGTLPDGTAIDLAICVVADVANGRITALREYFDTAAAHALIAALSNER